MISSRSNRLSATRGFTLLEILLATAVGAVVLLVINTTFFSALRLHNTTHDVIDRDLVIERTLGIVRRDLAGITLPPNPQSTNYSLSGQLSTDASSANDVTNTGERVSPDLYTSSGQIDGWSPYSEAQMVAYFLMPAADGNPNTRDLVRIVTRNLLASGEPAADTRTMLTGVISAGTAFLDGENWVDTWDSTTTSTLPTAIKFSLVLAPRDRNTARSDPAPVELLVPVLVKTTTTAQAEADAEAAGSLLQ